MEENQQRLDRLSRMSYGSLHTLLAGDPVQAAAWVRCAAECGVAAAQLRLGRMMLDGTGIDPDGPAAFGWFARAADQGDAEALNMVGRCHENGWGVPVDLECAAASYRASAKGGHDWGQYNLGNLLFDGRGVAPDRPQALRWFLQAASQGHGRAMNMVAGVWKKAGGASAAWKTPRTGTTGRHGQVTFVASTTMPWCSPSADCPRRPRTGSEGPQQAGTRRCAAPSPRRSRRRLIRHFGRYVRVSSSSWVSRRIAKPSLAHSDVIV